MVEKPIPKSRHFQASLETLFFTIGDPKSAKTRFQNYPKTEPFLESDKTTASCSRLHMPARGLRFRGLKGSQVASVRRP